MDIHWNWKFGWVWSKRWNIMESQKEYSNDGEPIRRSSLGGRMDTMGA